MNKQLRLDTLKLEAEIDRLEKEFYDQGKKFSSVLTTLNPETFLTSIEGYNAADVKVKIQQASANNFGTLKIDHKDYFFAYLCDHHSFHAFNNKGHMKELNPKQSAQLLMLNNHFDTIMDNHTVAEEDLAGKPETIKH